MPKCMPIKGKGKAKATEEDEDDDKATNKLWQELEDFVVPTTFDNKQLATLLLPLSEYSERNVKLPRGTKISDERKPDLTLVAPATQLQKNGA
ncbi:hypothetical protein C0995_005751, partial [Termitomyces sp. Mi166